MLAVPKKQVVGVQALDVPEVQKSCLLLSEAVVRETNSQWKETVGLDRKRLSLQAMSFMVLFTLGWYVPQNSYLSITLILGSHAISLSLFK